MNLKKSNIFFHKHSDIESVASKYSAVPKVKTKLQALKYARQSIEILI